MSFDLAALYKKMLTIREAELLIQKNYNNNEMKTPVHLAIGAEAIPCGVLHFFPKRRVFGTYRNHHWYLETTNDLEGFFLELLGKQKAPCQGRAGSMHLCDPAKGMILSSAIVATTLPIALGDSWAGLKMNLPEQTIVFFGDGAVEEGVFWETLNFSKLKNIPLLFVCEDNDLAIHSQKPQRHGFRLKDSIASYNIPYFSAQAYDIENVLHVTEKAISDLKNGPVFLHLDYFRALEHVGISEDFHFQYRSKPDDLQTIKDPLWTCRQKLLKAGTPETELLAIEEKVRQTVSDIYLRCLLEQDSDPAFVDAHVLKETHQ